MATVVGADNQFLYIDDNTGPIKKVPISAFGFDQVTGTVKQSQLATPTPDWINVKDYGAKGNTQAVSDAVLSGTHSVASATANFTQADIGKTCYAVFSPDGSLYAGVTTIATVVDIHHLTVTDGSFTTGSSNIMFVWGTDDTRALKDAWAAAQAANGPILFSSFGSGGIGTVYCPSGGYMFGSQAFLSTAEPGVSLRGDGPRATVFYPRPDFDFSTMVGPGMLHTSTISNSTAEVCNFSLNGCFIKYSVSDTFFALALGRLRSAHDIIVENVGSSDSSGTLNGVYVATLQSRQILQNITAFLISGAGGQAGIYIADGTGTMLNVQASNCTNDVQLSNVWLTVLGGLEDEGTVPIWKISNSSNVQIFGMYMLGDTVIQVQTGCVLRMFGCWLLPFGANPTTSTLLIDSGATVYASACRFDNTGGHAITNNGVLYNLGGNIIGDVNGSGVTHAVQFSS